MHLVAKKINVCLLNIITKKIDFFNYSISTIYISYITIYYCWIKITTDGINGIQ